MAHYIPGDDGSRIIWLTNFKAKFPISGAECGFSAAEIEEVLTACDTLIFSVQMARYAKTFSKVCTLYRNANLKSDKLRVAEIPIFTPPVAPAVMGKTNSLMFLQKTVQRLKFGSNYRAHIGAGLQILSSKIKQISREEAKPNGKIIALDNSIVRINWVKRNFVAVIVESKRGDESDWTEIGRDMASPYIDTRPPLVANLPEQRFYRLIYVVEDKPFGSYSDVLRAVTIP